MEIAINGRHIGKDNPCFIIAEAGVNHNGQIESAIKLIDAAVEAGADAVKFQTFKTDKLVTKTAEKAKYQKELTGDSESQYDMLKKLELKESDYELLSNYSKEKGILFLSTPFEQESVDLLDRINVPLFKIPSGEITNFPLLRYISKKGKPIILSTGMSKLIEIKDAVDYIKGQGLDEIILLHCISSYPAKIEDLNLLAIKTIKDAFGLPTGFSDHSPGIYAPIAAVSLGACVIEKHFTLDKDLPGPDHKASLDTEELIEMVHSIRVIEAALGTGEKIPTRTEEDIKKIARKSIVASRNLEIGTVLSKELVSIKRPGTGIPPTKIDEIIGKTVKRRLDKDDIIKMEDLE